MAFHLGAPSRASGCATDDWDCIANEQAAAVTAKWNEVWGEGGLEDQIGDLKTEIEAFAGDVEDVLDQFEATATALAASPLAFNNELVRRVKDGLALANYFLSTESADLLAFVNPGGCNPATCEPFREQLGELLVQMQGFLDAQGEILARWPAISGLEPPDLVQKVDLTILAELVQGTDTRPGVPGLLLFPLYQALSTYADVRESASSPLGFASACSGGDSACLAIAAFNETLGQLQDTVREIWADTPPNKPDANCLAWTVHRDPDHVARLFDLWYLLSSVVQMYGEAIEYVLIMHAGLVPPKADVGVSVAATATLTINQEAVLAKLATFLRVGGKLSLEGAKAYRGMLTSCRHKMNNALIVCNMISAGNSQANLIQGRKSPAKSSDALQVLTYDQCEERVGKGEYFNVIF